MDSSPCRNDTTPVKAAAAAAALAAAAAAFL